MTVELNPETVVGVVATIVVAVLFFVLGGWQLRSESRRLRAKVNMVLVGLQNAGLIELSFDDKGEPVGLNVTVRPEPVALKADLPRAEAGEAPPPSASGENPDR